MSSITDTQKTDLLFKEFNVVANTRQDVGYQLQSFAFRDNILNDDILAEGVPTSLPSGYTLLDLDNCGNITNGSSFNLASAGYPQLTFYKKLQLTAVPNGQNQSYYSLDASGNNILRDTIPFKFDESASDSYNFRLYVDLSYASPPQPPGTYSLINKNQSGTLYLMDTKSGFIQFYATSTALSSRNPPITSSSPPFFSFIKYTGTKGITGGGGGGGGGDVSYNTIDASNINVSNDLIVDGQIIGTEGTTFVDYKDYSSDISGATGPADYCIAIIPTAPGGENARGLFILDDDTSGFRQQIIFYAGISYTRGAYINVLANNYFSTSPLITGLKIDVSGGNLYGGTNLYLTRGNTLNVTDLHVRLYQNGRTPSQGGQWNLTSSPLAGLDANVVDLDITFNQSGGRANTVSTLDTVFNGYTQFNNPAEFNANSEFTQALTVQGTLTSTSDIQSVDIENSNNINTLTLNATGLIEANGGIDVGLNPPNGNLTVHSSSNLIGHVQMNDASANNIDISQNLIVNNTQFLQKIGPQSISIAPVPYYRIAKINMSTSSTPPSGPTVCSGRFIIKVENDYNILLEFIAGFYCDSFTLTGPPPTNNIRPFIKVISSNGQDIISNSINYIAIGCETSLPGPQDSNIDLLIGFSSSGVTANNIVVRLYQNNEGKTSGTYRDWELDSQLIQTTGPAIPGLYTIYKKLNLDTFNDISGITGTSLAMSSLDSETFLGNVNVGQKLTVLNGIDLSGSITAIDPSGIIDISANINVGDVTMGDLTVNGDLQVIGESTLSDTTINGSTLNINTSKTNFKVFTTIDASGGVQANMYSVKMDFLAATNTPFKSINSTDNILIQSSNFEFFIAGAGPKQGIGGNLIDLSGIYPYNGNLNLVGSLNFDASLSYNNIITGLTKIEPYIGSNLTITSNIDLCNNDIINIDKITTGSGILTISGDILFSPSAGDISNVNNLRVYNLYSSNGNTININSNVNMANNTISNVGGLNMTGNIDLSGNSIDDVFYIRTKNIYGDASLSIQTQQGDIDIGSFQGDVNIQANIGNLNLSQRLVSYNPVEMDFSGNGYINITNKEQQSGGQIGGMNITPYVTQDKKPHAFDSEITSTVISDMSRAEVPYGAMSIINNISSDVSNGRQSQETSLPLIKLQNKALVDNNIIKYMYLGNENQYQFFNRRPGRDEIGQVRKTDTTTSTTPYIKDGTSGFQPNTATRFVQGSGGISYWYWDVSNATSTATESICKFEVQSPISGPYPISSLWDPDVITEYKGNNLAEYKAFDNSYNRIAVPSRNTVGPYAPRDGYITQVSYSFPFWQGDAIIGIAGPIIFRNLGTGTVDSGAPYVSLYIDCSYSGATTIGGNSIGEIELKRYPASLGTTLIPGTGDTITLPPTQWIYVKQGTNLSQLVKMRLYIPKIGTGYDGMSIGIAGGALAETLPFWPSSSFYTLDIYDIGAIQGYINIVSLPTYVDS